MVKIGERSGKAKYLAVLALLCGVGGTAPAVYAASSYSYDISQRSSSESGEKGIFYGDVHVSADVSDVDWSTVREPAYSLSGSDLESEIKNTHIYGSLTEDTLTVGKLVYDIGAVNFTNMSPRAAETTKTLVSVSDYSDAGTLNFVPSDWTMSGDFKSATKTITDDYIKSGTGYTVKGDHTDTISAVSEASGGKYNSSLNYTVGTATITDIKLDFGRIEVNTWSTLPFLSVNAEDSTQDYSTDKVTIKAQNYNNIFGTTNESVSGTKTLVSITGTNAGVSGNITAKTDDGAIPTEGVTVSKDFSDSITPYGEVQTFAFGGNHTDTIKEERNGSDTYKITYTVGKKLIKNIGVHTINLSGFTNGSTFYTADAQYRLNDAEQKTGELPVTTVNLDKLKFKNMPDYFYGTLLAFEDTSGLGSLELQLVDGGESYTEAVKELDYSAEATGVSLTGKRVFNFKVVDDKSVQMSYTADDTYLTDADIDLSKIGGSAEGNISWNTSSPLYQITADTYKQDYAEKNLTVNLNHADGIFGGATDETLDVGESMTLLTVSGKNAGKDGSIKAKVGETEAGTGGATISVAFSDTRTASDGSSVVLSGTHDDLVKGTSKSDDSYALTYTIGNKAVSGISFGADTIAVQDGSTYFTANEQYILKDTVAVDVGAFTLTDIPDDEFDMTLISFTNKTGGGSLTAANESAVKPKAYREKESEAINGILASGKRAIRFTTADEGASLRISYGEKEVTNLTVGAVDMNRAVREFTNLSAEGGTVDLSDAKIENLNLTLDDIGGNKTLATATGNTFGDNWTLQNGSDITAALEPANGITGVLTGSYNTADGNLNLGIGLTSLTFGEGVAWEAGSTALDLSGKDVDLSKTVVDASHVSFTLKEPLSGSEMTLLRTTNTQKLQAANVKHNENISMTLGGAMQISGKTETVTEGDYTDVIASLDWGSAKVDESTHHGVMATAAGLAAVAGTAVETVDTVGAALSAVFGKDVMTFAHTGGSSLTTETGSHVKSNLWNVNLGVGAKNALKNGGHIEYAVYYEGGRGNYTSHDDAAAMTEASGKLTQHGAGLFLRYEAPNLAYGEIGFHGGRIKNEAETMGFNESANYYGWHVGAGKILQIDEKRSLDIYGKFFYNHTGGMDYTGADGTKYHLDGTASKLLRIGGRYNITTGNRGTFYAGLAYSYEFGGKTNGQASYYGVTADLRPTSTRGASGMLELGYKWEADKQNPWEIDLGVKGYAGRQKGFGADIGIKYRF